MKPIQDNFKAAVEKAAKAKKIDTVVVPGGIIYGTISADLTKMWKRIWNKAEKRAGSGGLAGSMTMMNESFSLLPLEGGGAKRRRLALQYVS